MDEPISRAEHEEFARRIDAQEKRQDRRLELLEENVREIGALTVSVQKLAQSLQSMVKEQEQQGRRLQALESRDGEKWRKLMGYIATALTSGAVTLLGVLIANSRSQAVTETKLDELTQEVREHNNFARRMPVVEEQIKDLNRRLSALERK